MLFLKILAPAADRPQSSPMIRPKDARRRTESSDLHARDNLGKELGVGQVAEQNRPRDLLSCKGKKLPLMPEILAKMDTQVWSCCESESL